MYGTAAHRSQGTGFASLRVLDSGILPCRWVTKAARPPFAKGFDRFKFCLHDTLLPAGGEGGRRKRKEPHDGKKSSHTDTTETPCGFLRSCGIRKTSLRQRLHSTATSFGYFQYIRNGCSSQGSKRKKCSRKIYGGTSTGLGFERTAASTASVCTLAEKRCLPYRSGLLISKHIRCGHTPEK